jgi:hypothetical protein
MPLDDDGRTALYLAGTIRLPCFPPAMGDVSEVDGDYIAITQHVSDSARITYVVRPGDVRAIFGPWDGEGRPPSYKFTDDVTSYLEGNRALPTPAAVYVPEAAPVLVQAQVGLTAAEACEHCGSLLCLPRPCDPCC